MNQNITSGNYDKFNENLKYCLILSATLSDVLKNSNNIVFRKQCFKILKTDSSFGVETALMTHFSSIISHDSQKEHRNDKK